MQKILNSRFSPAFIAAFLLLSVMAGLMLYRAATKTTIVDESPHIVAGYGYVAKQDYRLNPEHPPLIKMISALPLVFQDINFIEDRPSWTEDVNGQWSGGDEFIHWERNDPVSLMFWGRVGPTLITLLTGLITFVWARKRYGSIAGLFALTLFAFSPTFLAHGPLITTDVAAAFGFLLATYYLFKYLEDQTRKNLIMAGVAFGIAQLLKFSLILLLPYFTMVAIGWVLFKDRPGKVLSRATAKRMLVYIGKLVAIGVIGLIVVYPVYQYSVLNYPIEKQVYDTNFTLDSHPWNGGPLEVVPNAVRWMADKPVLRAYGQFFMGHLMVFQRVAGGNTVYYLGDVAATAWASYFPVVFLLKVPLALLFMMAIANYAVFKEAFKRMRVRLSGSEHKIKETVRMKYEWISEYFVEASLLLFIVFYFVVSILGNLNIGLRHVLPTFPFLYILLAGILHKWMHKGFRFQTKGMLNQLKELIDYFGRKWIKTGIIVSLVIWYILSPMAAFPHMIPYFNEAAGGPENGHNLVADSNLDWGQDLRALVEYTQENNIETIKLAYFGGGNPQYYFCEDLLFEGRLGDCDRFSGFDPFNVEERSGWIAISATLLQEGRATATKGYDRSTTHYMWLNDYEPVAVIGHSIFVYHIPENI